MYDARDDAVVVWVGGAYGDKDEVGGQLITGGTSSTPGRHPADEWMAWFAASIATRQYSAL